MVFINGYLIGLGFLFFIGPVLFYSIKCTLDAGFWSGVSVALGIIFGDFLCMVICSLGAVPFFKNTSNQFMLSIIGSLILMFLGLKFIFKPQLQQDANEKVNLSKRNYVSFFVQGFLINFINPFVFVIWIGLIGVAQSNYNTTTDVILFLSSILLGVLTVELAKVVLAHRIKRLLNPNYMVKIYRVFGVILILFSIWLLVYAYILHK